MKTLILTFIFCLLNLTVTDIIGKYQIESELSYDTLEIKQDGTYEYQSRGDSCWTWTDITGTWELKGDLLILHHNFSYVESATEYIEKVNEVSEKHVTIDVKDNFGNPISDFEINYTSLDDKTQTKKTDKNGIVIFEKYDIVFNEGDTAGIHIQYEANGNETSESMFVDRLADRISIKINNQPKTIEKNEEYKFLVDKRNLKSIEFPYVGEISTYKKL
jgi:hypothetical protein